MLTLNDDYSLIHQSEIKAYESEVAKQHQKLHGVDSPYEGYLGWLDPRTYLQNREYQEVKALALEIQQNAEALIVVGVGGSFLSAKAIIRAMSHTFQYQSDNQRMVLFANSLSGVYLTELLELVKTKNLYVNVVSKSGSTLETAIIFRQIKAAMEEKYGKPEAARRIIATTDEHRGQLLTIAQQEGYRTLTIPDDIGGRFSAFTSAALLAVAVKGIDTDQLLAGAQAAAEEYANPSLEANAAYRYAVLRNILYHKGRRIEMLVNHEYKMMYFADWFKQLFGESEGKDGKGLFPVSVNYTADLHSFGQYVQDGAKLLFETSIQMKSLDRDMTLATMEENADGLDYLLGHTLNQINQTSLMGAVLAHSAADVPNIIIELAKNDTYHLGQLLYFFMKACAVSAGLMGVHPFNQPGVEAYKVQMRNLLHR